MLSKSQAKAFFLVGTALCSIAFIGLTIDTFQRIPGQTKEENLTPEVIQGKHLFEQNNCMGCHTIFGEGAYYAPELTKVYERRGAAFINQMLIDPEAMYPGQRKMVTYDFTEEERKSLIAFFKWIGEVDLNGFPAKPDLAPVADAAALGANGEPIVKSLNRPKVYNQMCVACHQLQGQGGAIGPSLDGIGSRRTAEYIRTWLQDPLAVNPESKMPKLPLSDEDIVELTAFLSQLKDGE